MQANFMIGGNSVCSTESLVKFNQATSKATTERLEYGQSVRIELNSKQRVATGRPFTSSQQLHRKPKNLLSAQQRGKLSSKVDSKGTRTQRQKHTKQSDYNSLALSPKNHI